MSQCADRSTLLAGPFRLREVAYQPFLKQPTHAHDTMGVTLVISGAIREAVGRRQEIAGPLSVVVKPAGVEHRDDIGPDGAHTLQILFDPSVGETPGAPEELLEWRWLHGEEPASLMLMALSLLRSRSPTDDVASLVLDILGAVPPAPRLRGVPPLWIRQVREAIDDQPLGSPPVAELARDVGAHAVSVSRAFRRHYGCSITEYRRRSRLRRAAAAIAHTTEPFSSIAHASGYADHAHLCRDFRAVTGLTPSGYRALAGRC